MKGKELFTASLAERIKDGSVGSLYRPSNGTEGAMFMDMYCMLCVKDKAFRDGTGETCDIIFASMCYDIDEEGYPKEWVYDVDGQPTCTGFVEVK